MVGSGKCHMTTPLTPSILMKTSLTRGSCPPQYDKVQYPEFYDEDFVQLPPEPIQFKAATFAFPVITGRDNGDANSTILRTQEQREEIENVTFDTYQRFGPENGYPWEANIVIPEHFTMADYILERALAGVAKYEYNHTYTGEYRFRHDPGNGKPLLAIQRKHLKPFEEHEYFWHMLENHHFCYFPHKLDMSIVALHARFCPDHASPYFSWAFLCPEEYLQHQPTLDHMYQYLRTTFSFGYFKTNNDPFSEDYKHFGRFDRAPFPFMDAHWGNPSTPKFRPLNDKAVWYPVVEHIAKPDGTHISCFTHRPYVHP